MVVDISVQENPLYGFYLNCATFFLRGVPTIFGKYYRKNPKTIDVDDGLMILNAVIKTIDGLLAAVAESGGYFIIRKRIVNEVFMGTMLSHLGSASSDGVKIFAEYICAELPRFLSTLPERQIRRDAAYMLELTDDGSVICYRAPINHRPTDWDF